MSREQNPVRIKLKEGIRHALEEADSASCLRHPGLIGAVREIILTDLFTPILPLDVQHGTGKISDHLGSLSDQVDVILYSRNILPPSLYNERQGIFPVESVCYTVEIKSKLTAQTMTQAIENARSIHNLTSYLPDHWLAGKQIKRKGIPRPVTTLLALSSDLSGDGKSELDRYLEIAQETNSDSPTLTAFCVVGRGYWHSKGTDWYYVEPNLEYEEVLDFLGGVVNTLPQILSWKGRVRYGGYIESGREYKKVQSIR